MPSVIVIPRLSSQTIYNIRLWLLSNDARLGGVCKFRASLPSSQRTNFGLANLITEDFGQ